MIPTAMSGAERQRRYPDRLLKSGASATDSDYALAQQQLTATQLELKKAKARIAELEKALAAAQRNTSSRAQKRASLRARITAGAERKRVCELDVSEQAHSNSD